MSSPNRPGYHDAGELPFRRRAVAEYRGIDLSTQVVPPEPHPETGASVRRLHLWLVESAVFFHGTDANAISGAVCLPVWNVRPATHPRPPVTLIVRRCPTCGGLTRCGCRRGTT